MFTVQTNEIIEAAKSMKNNCDTAVPTMNHQKNLPHLKQECRSNIIRDNNGYIILSIHNNVSGLATMFLYLKHFSVKAINEILSCYSIWRPKSTTFLFGATPDIIISIEYRN